MCCGNLQPMPVLGCCRVMVQALQWRLESDCRQQRCLHVNCRYGLVSSGQPRRLLVAVLHLKDRARKCHAVYTLRQTGMTAVKSLTICCTVHGPGSNIAATAATMLSSNSLASAATALQVRFGQCVQVFALVALSKVLLRPVPPCA